MDEGKKAQFFEILRQCGEKVALYLPSEGDTFEKSAEMCALVEPIRLKAYRETPETYSPLGRESDYRWLYIGPPEPVLEQDVGYVVWGEKMFDIVRAQVMRCRGENVYVRAILKKRGEGDHCG